MMRLGTTSSAPAKPRDSVQTRSRKRSRKASSKKVSTRVGHSLRNSARNASQESRSWPPWSPSTPSASAPGRGDERVRPVQAEVEADRPDEGELGVEDPYHRGAVARADHDAAGAQVAVEQGLRAGHEEGAQFGDLGAQSGGSERKAAARSSRPGCQWLCSCSRYGSLSTTSSVILHSSGLTDAAIRALRSAEAMPKSLVAKVELGDELADAAGGVRAVGAALVEDRAQHLQVGHVLHDEGVVVGVVAVDRRDLVRGDLGDLLVGAGLGVGTLGSSARRGPRPAPRAGPA